MVGVLIRPCPATRVQENGKILFSSKSSFWRSRTTSEAGQRAKQDNGKYKL
ncbi:MAG: hypothetical protein ABJH01_18445 [Algoriphagus sp.]|uniref:hypothetical protein n=1 Tax=Algoriphagus sp. TaxID=1872435 RepID=UPI003297D8CA